MNISTQNIYESLLFSKNAVIMETDQTDQTKASIIITPS